MAKMSNKWDVYMSGALSDLTPEEFAKVTEMIYERASKQSHTIQWLNT